MIDAIEPPLVLFAWNHPVDGIGNFLLAFGYREFRHCGSHGSWINNSQKHWYYNRIEVLNINYPSLEIRGNLSPLYSPHGLIRHMLDKAICGISPICLILETVQQLVAIRGLVRLEICGIKP